MDRPRMDRDRFADYIRRWDGSTWREVGGGLFTVPQAFAEFDDGIGQIAIDEFIGSAGSGDVSSFHGVPLALLLALAFAFAA